MDRSTKRQVFAGIAAAVLLTAAVIAGAGVLLRGGGAGAGGLASEASSTATGADLGADPGAAAIPGAEQRPDCPGKGVAGVELPCLGGHTGAAGAADAAAGNVTLVSLWAWWCEPCREELPLLQAYADAHPEVQVVGVHADGNAAAGVALLNDLGVRLPSYQDADGAFAGQLGLPGVVPILLMYRGGERVGMFARPFASTSELETAVTGVL